jgi:protocatechuate 3,4-dioxygenase alpha subunit
MNSDDGKLIASASQTVGPFFHFGPGDHPQLGSLVTPGTQGERIRVLVRVLDGDLVPVPDALIEIWQADAGGRHAAPASSAPRTDVFHGFGRLPTAADGTCLFETIRPGPVGASEAAHINLCVFMRGLLRHIYTRLYFAGDPDLATDPVLALVPDGRRATLVARPDPSDSGLWTFEIRLQGDQETVFFDL